MAGITKAERQELRGVVRSQFRVLRLEVRQRQAELVADGEQQILDRFRGTDTARADIDEQATAIMEQALRHREVETLPSPHLEATKDRVHNVQGPPAGPRTNREATTVGWTTCGCEGADGLRLDGFHTGPGWRPGLVLDPFAGSGTTLMVATGHGRDALGIDLDERNADLARERCGMFLTVETLGEPEQLAGRPVIDEAAL